MTLPLAPFAAKFYDGGGAVFNVKHPLFGAKGDGVTDDTASIQAAVDAAGAVGGIRQGAGLYFPAGIYITEPLVTRGANNLDLCGASYTTTTIKLKAGANATLLTLDAGLISLANQQGCRIRNITLDGNGANQTGESSVLRISSAWDTRLGPGLAIRNAYSDGIIFSTDGGSGCVQNWIDGIYVERCGIGGVGYGIHFTENVQQIPVRNGIIQWCVSGGIYFDTLAGSPSTSMLGPIEDVYMETHETNVQAYGIILKAPVNANLTVRRCLFNGMTVAPIWMTGIGTQGLKVADCQSGNTVGSYSVVIDVGNNIYLLENNHWDKPLSIEGVDVVAQWYERVTDGRGVAMVGGNPNLKLVVSTNPVPALLRGNAGDPVAVEAMLNDVSGYAPFRAQDLYAIDGIYVGASGAGVKVVGAQGEAVEDATDNPSAIIQLNVLLARMRAHGLIAT